MGANEYERSVLGAVLLNPELWCQVAGLRQDDFSIESNRKIYARMVDLAESARPIDLRTLIEELERHEELQSVGDVSYISSLVDGVLGGPSIQHHVRMVREAAERRCATKLLEKAQRIADDPTVPTAALAEIGSELTEVVAGGEFLPPRFSEEALALRFSRRHAEDLRYVSRWGHWMRWDGIRWVDDDTLHVFDLARGICGAASVECGEANERLAIRIAAAQTVTAIERLARADRCHAAKVEQWDTDPWLLNTPAGTVDLRTGEIRKHSRDEYITRITTVGPGGDCPLWLRFLDRVTGGDLELQSFLQRMIGYSLTGFTREHALFFLYGTGANGKSVFLSTISGLLAEYAKTAASSSFSASANEQHPTDVAGLRGARLVIAIETEDGARWAESKIKSLTGGDKIAARFMRCDFFEFLPEFKLVIAGNHKPGLRSVDEAIRRRLHLIPFTVTIPREERDPRLAEKLKTEFSGILAWAILGCLEWQQLGLSPPAIVRNATADYLASEDPIGRWLEDDCIEDQATWTSSAELFADCRAWCERTGETPISPKRITQGLEGRGFVQKRTTSARGVSGIALRRGMTHVTDGPVIPVNSARGRPI
jgi:putative DNA primase/helicase